MIDYLISVIIVNFNGLAWLKKLLPDLSKQTYSNYEIIIVDNGSVDSSIQFIKSSFPECKIVKLKKNHGFASANNIGYTHSKGKYILLLNNDMRVEPDFLKTFSKAFKKIPNLGSVQCELKLLDNPDYLDSVGSKFGKWGQFSYLGIESKSREYKQPFPVLANIGAAMMVKREVIEKIGLFDDKFFMYFEDADFCHRAWLSGWECWYYPKASALHAKRGTSSKSFGKIMRFHDFKNGIRSQIKNYEISTLIRQLPQYIFYQLFLSFLLLFKFNPRIIYDLGACLWNMIYLADTLKKRTEIQRLRSVDDASLNKRLSVN